MGTNKMGYCVSAVETNFSLNSHHLNNNNNELLHTDRGQCANSGRLTGWPLARLASVRWEKVQVYNSGTE